MRLNNGKENRLSVFIFANIKRSDQLETSTSVYNIYPGPDLNLFNTRGNMLKKLVIAHIGNIITRGSNVVIFMSKTGA